MSDAEQLERARSRVGTVLREKWRLVRLLGLGGFAAVYEAVHRTGKPVAVKILHPELAFRKSIRERFVREAYAANSIAHPGIVSVLDDDQTEDGAPFLVMDLLEGETLEAKRVGSGGRLGAKEVLVVADQVLDVLAVAHDKGVVHRDLKPENLFVRTDGRVHVLDFGIARLMEMVSDKHGTETGVPMGTPAFMPPEQARGRWKDVGPRSDLWAVGATLFTLLAGRFVHPGETGPELLVAAMTQHAPPLESVCPGVPPEVARVVDRALAFAPGDRWPTARAMRGAVHAAARALGVTSELGPPPFDDDPTDDGHGPKPIVPSGRGADVDPTAATTPATRSSANPVGDGAPPQSPPPAFDALTPQATSEPALEAPPPAERQPSAWRVPRTVVLLGLVAMVGAGSALVIARQRDKAPAVEGSAEKRPSFEDLRRRARQERERAMAIHPPRYEGDGEMEDVKAFFKGPLNAWVAARRNATEPAASLYNEAASAAPEASLRVEALSELVPLFEEFVREFLDAPIPNGIRKDAKIRALYRASLDEAARPNRERALAAAVRCDDLARQNHIATPAAARCAEARARLATPPGANDEESEAPSSAESAVPATPPEAPHVAPTAHEAKPHPTAARVSGNATATAASPPTTTPKPAKSDRRLQTNFDE